MTERLHIDWTRCQGRGACMELLPELIRSDDWGYPIAIDGHPELKVPGALIDYARRAVKECPRLALTLLPDGA